MPLCVCVCVRVVMFRYFREIVFRLALLYVTHQGPQPWCFVFSSVVFASDAVGNGGLGFNVESEFFDLYK